MKNAPDVDAVAVTREQHALVRLQRLQALSAELIGSTTATQVYEAVVSAGRDAMDAAAVGIALFDTARQSLDVQLADGFSPDLLARFGSVPLTKDTPLTRAFLTGEPQLYPDDVAMREAFPHLDLEPRFKARGAVPLLSPGGCLGGLTFSFTGDRAFDTDEVDLLLALSRQAGIALERIALMESARARQRRDAYLNRVSQDLYSSLEGGQVADALLRAVVPDLADWAVLHLEDPAGATGTYRATAAAHADERCQQAMERSVLGARVSCDDTSDLATALRTRSLQHHAVLPAAVTTRLQRVPAAAGLGHASTGVVVPLVSAGHCWGALTVARAGEAYGGEEVAILDELGGRAATALQHAVSYGAQRRSALELQLALLPPETPRLPGLEIGWRYVPGTAGALIGGDWYDVLETAPGRVLLVVGDVMGHGLAAAAVMGQLRTTVRALTRVQVSPEEMLRMLDDELQRLAPDRLATLVTVEVDLARSTARVTNAGHLPPVLVTASGAALVPTPAGSPLGVGLPPSVHDVALPEGWRLVLYTDGLVEDRTQGLDAGLTRLVSASADLPPDAHDAAASLLDRMGRSSSHDDDVAVLVASESRR